MPLNDDVQKNMFWMLAGRRFRAPAVLRLRILAGGLPEKLVN